tara:strand:+ start:971 stop:2047 length:1077 start_codon:yes stop_codon:yes gene_type:complete
MKKTPLYKEHVELNAKMVNFGGFNMPIQYQGISIEHNCVRNNVGIFDVSHMGEFFVSGKDSSAFLNYICTNDIYKIEINGAQYNCFTNNNGGIVDDLIIYRCNEQEYMLVVNASNIEKDWNWIKTNLGGYQCEITNESENIGLISVQGPKSIYLINDVFNQDFSSLKKFNFQEIFFYNSKIIISNTGYTGSKGFEIYINKEVISLIWNDLLIKGEKYGLQPIGLGARDTLRMEMGYCLYGNDIDDNTTPYEANLMWATNLNKDFIGKDRVINSMNKSLNKMIHFKMIERGIPRNGYEICDASGKIIGNVTSGTFSPTHKTGIGIGYINKKFSVGESIYLKIRDKLITAEIVKLPLKNG